MLLVLVGCWRWLGVGEGKGVTMHELRRSCRDWTERICIEPSSPRTMPFPLNHIPSVGLTLCRLAGFPHS